MFTNPKPTPAKVASSLKKAAYGRGNLVMWINSNSTAIGTVYRHTVQSLVASARQARPATGELDMESWAKWLKLGKKYAEKICSGDVKIDGPDGRISVRSDGKSYTNTVRLFRGTYDGDPMVSDGNIAFPCANPPPYNEVAVQQAMSGIKAYPDVEIVSVPDFEGAEIKGSSLKDEDLVLLSNGAGVNPLYLAAVVAAVGSPYTLRHGSNVLAPVGVFGPKGTGVAMPVRREAKKNPRRYMSAQGKLL